MTRPIPLPDDGEEVLMDMALSTLGAAGNGEEDPEYTPIPEMRTKKERNTITIHNFRSRFSAPLPSRETMLEPIVYVPKLNARGITDAHYTELPLYTYRGSLHGRSKNGKRYVRLLRLECSQDSEAELQGSLVDVPLHDNPEYDALSYTWSSPDDNTQQYALILDGSKFSIGHNLMQALNRLRLKNNKDYVTLWVDAICINQGDEQERNHQVNIMREIYGQAKCVRIWLGGEDDNSSAAFELCHDLVRATDDTEVARILSDLDPHRSLQITAFQEMLHRNYWKRIWVIQEVNIAKKAKVVCGADVILWQDLFRAQNLIVASRDACWRLVRDNPNLASFASDVFHEGPRGLMIEGESGMPTLFEALRKHCTKLSSRPEDKSRCSEAPLTIKHISRVNFSLIHWWSSANGIRHLVYGLVGLTTAGADSRFVIDYARGTRQIFIDAAIYIIESSGSLDILCTMHQNTEREETEDQNLSFTRRAAVSGLTTALKGFVHLMGVPVSLLMLEDITEQPRLRTIVPSWVPDWEAGVPSWLLDSSIDVFEASLGKSSKIAFAGQNKDVLKARGLCIGTIRNAGPRLFLNERNEDEDIAAMIDAFCKWVSMLKYPNSTYANCRTLLLAFCRTFTCGRIMEELEILAGQSPDQAVQHIMGIFALISSGAFSKTRDKNVMIVRELALLKDEVRQLGGSDDQLEAWARVMLLDLRAIISRRRFFFAEGDVMGMAYCQAQKGDRVCVLLGCSTLVILRPRTEGLFNNTFTFVGDAYVEGYMFGKGVRDAEAKLRAMQTFAIH